MALTLSSVLIPTYTKGLQTLAHILNAAEEHARSQNLDPDAEYPDAKLAPDMLPLTFQVQNATRTVSTILAQLENKPDQAATWENSEKTVADLKERVGKALALVAAVDQAVVDQRAWEVIDLAVGPTVQKVPATAAALNYGIPNFFFHLQTAYAILRSKGVPLGKRDYLGPFFAP